jgi:alpha-glucoside transport system permease protein
MAHAVITPDEIKERSKPLRDRLSSPWASFTAIMLAVLWTIPTFGLLVTSVRPQVKINSNGWWNFFRDPEVTLENYTAVLFKGSGVSTPLSQYFVNTIVIAIPSTLIPLTLAVLAAYGLAWFEFRGRDFLFFFIFALQVVPLQMSLIPLLQLFSGGLHIGTVTIIPDLNITGTFIPIWLAHSMFGLPLAIFLIHNFVAQIPRELVESARVDGADAFKLFRTIILPLSIPAIASFSIFQFLWVWNDLLVGLTFGGGKQSIAPLTVRLAELTGTRGGDWHLLTAGAFVSMIVPVAVFFALQRYFVRGLLAGSVKG